MKTPRAIALAAFCTGCFAHGGFGGGAPEGLTIVRRQGTSPPEVLIVDGERMRMEKGGEGHRSITIVDARAPRIIEIDETDRTYVELGEKELERLAGDAAPELRFDATGERRTINGIACEMYQGIKGGQLWEEDCIAPWDAGVFHKQDFVASSQLVRARLKAPAMVEQDVLTLLDLFPGFPIERRPLMGRADILGENTPPEEVESVTRGPLPAGTFAAPAGFSKVSR